MPQTLKNFMWYVDKETFAPCWEWTGGISENGYGKTTANYKTMTAHKYSYEQHKGPVPEGLEIDHTCENKTCVNPDHLDAVTHQANIDRKMAKIVDCKRGHPLSGMNLYMTPDGRRQCRTCRGASAEGTLDMLGG